MLNIVFHAIMAVGVAVAAFFDVGGCMSALSTTSFLSTTTPFLLFTTYYGGLTSELGDAFQKALSPLAAPTSPVSSTFFHSKDLILLDDAFHSRAAIRSSLTAVLHGTESDILNDIGTVSGHHGAAPSAPPRMARTAFSITSPSLKLYAIGAVTVALFFQIVLLVIVVGYLNVRITGPMDSNHSRVEVERDSDNLGMDTLPLQDGQVFFADQDDSIETPIDANGSVSSLGRMELDSSQVEADNDSDDLRMDAPPLQDGQVFFADQDDSMETPIDANGSVSNLGRMELDSSQVEADNDSDDLRMDVPPLQDGQVFFADQDDSIETPIDANGSVSSLGRMELDSSQVEADNDLDAPPLQDGQVFFADQDDSTETIIDANGIVSHLGRMELGSSQVEADRDSDDLRMDAPFVEDQADAGCDWGQRADETIVPGVGINAGLSYGEGDAMEVLDSRIAFPGDKSEDNRREDDAGRTLDRIVDEDDVPSDVLGKRDEYDVDSRNDEVRASRSVFSETLQCRIDDLRSAGPTVSYPSWNFTYPPPPQPISPRHHFSDIVTSGPRRPFARPQTALFNKRDLETVRRIVTPQENRRPLANHAHDRPQNQPRSTQVSAYMGIQKPLPLPGGHPSLPFQENRRPLGDHARDHPQNQPRSMQVSAYMGIQKPLPLPGGPPSLPFQENRRPFRDHTRDRPQNQSRSTQVSAHMSIQKPLPLPGGPPSLPFQGKSNGARKRRLRREAREAEERSRVDEGLR